MADRLDFGRVTPSRLYELAALAISLVAVGAILVAPGVPNEARAGGIGVILAGLLLVASITRRSDE